MQREEKSERSRRLVLDAALKLFSKQGYRATSVREIADSARVSIGNLYHHFPDKESIFRTLLDEYREMTKEPKFPLVRALTSGMFPDNLEEIGYAARDAVKQYRAYMALQYVDVIEFNGTHIRDLYRDLADKLESFLAERGVSGADIATRLRPGVSPMSAVLVSTRLFLVYFQLEILFGVSEPFGKDSTQMVREIADIICNGISRQEKK